MKAVERIQRHAARTTPGFAIGEAEFQALGRAAAAAARPAH
ncbi:hypothetical protein Save01_03300 [Streptomyces avermitilis]|nr:hypothetical protein [Streptomyces avermitilis]